jgi:hypothetical protein
VGMSNAAQQNRGIFGYEELFQSKGRFYIGGWFSLLYMSETAKKSKYQPEVGWYIYFEQFVLDSYGFHKKVIHKTFHDAYEEAKKIYADGAMMAKLKKAARIGSEHLK